MKRRVALLGCGRWGRHILRDLVSLGCDVIVVDPSDESRQRALRAGATHVVRTLTELPPIEGAVVATPTTTHADVVEALVPRAVPIFCEKPLTTDPKTAARLARLAPRHLFVMDKWRYHPGVELLGQVVRSAELGPVLGLQTARVGWANSHSDADGVWILAPHDLSIVLEVLGNIPAPRTAIAERLRDTPVGLHAVLGDCRDGPWVILDVSILGPERRREVRLHCRDGIVVLNDAHSDRVDIIRTAACASDATDATERRPVPTQLPLVRELETFLNHLAGGPPPRSSAAEAACVVSFLAQLRELAGLAS